MDASPGYQNLKVGKKIPTSTYLTNFTYQFGRYRFAALPFRVELEGDIFQEKKRQDFKDLSDVFGIGDDILIVGCDAEGIDNDRMLW